MYHAKRMWKLLLCLIMIAGTLSLTSGGKASASDGEAAAQSVIAPASDEEGDSAENSSKGVGISDEKPLAATIVVDKDKLGIGQSSLVTVTFSEPVTGFDLYDMSPQYGTLSGLETLDNITYTTTLTPTLNNNIKNNVITLDLKGVADKIGNSGTGTTVSNPYELDSLRPTSTIAIAHAKLKAGQTSQVTFTFSEAVTGFSNDDLTVANGTLSDVSSNDGGMTWTATLTPASGIQAQTNIITLDNTGVTDLAGNAGVGTTNSANYEISTVRPTATITIASGKLIAGQTTTVTFTFSEAVAGFSNADLTVANGTLSYVSSDDGGMTWTATLTPALGIQDQTNIIMLDNTGVANSTGNVGIGTTYSANYEIDTLRPTATIAVADDELKAGETSLVTITFSEAVTGFDLSDLTLQNGTLSNLISMDGGTTWTATLTPSGNVHATDNFITLDNSRVLDAAGNSGEGITKSNPYTVVTEPASAALSRLTLSSGTLSPVFEPETTNYTANVPYNVSALKVSATTQDRSSTLTMNGNLAASGQASKDISLSVGTNIITVIVTAADSSTKTYTISVTRAQKETGEGGGNGSGGGGSISGGGNSNPLVIPSDDKVVSTNGKLTIPPGKAGELRLGDAVMIAIPAHATKQEMKLTIGVISDTRPLLTNHEVFASPVFELLKSSPENFDKPVTITITFDPASLKRNQTVAVFYYDEAKKNWIKVENGRIKENRIAVDVDHFTKFTVLAIDEATGLPVTGEPAEFSDISGHWAEASIRQAASIGIVTGYPDGTFKQGKTITRAEFAVMLINALNLQQAGAELAFEDSSSIGEWAQPAVAQAVQLGMMKGYENGTFRPNAEITRAEMAVALANAVGRTGAYSTEAGFADDNDIPNWAKASAAFVKQTGIMQGKDGNQFVPQDAATRAEVVTVLLHVLEFKGWNVSNQSVSNESQ